MVLPTVVVVPFCVKQTLAPHRSLNSSCKWQDMENLLFLGTSVGANNPTMRQSVSHGIQSETLCKPESFTVVAE